MTERPARSWASSVKVAMEEKHTKARAEEKAAEPTSEGVWVPRARKATLATTIGTAHGKEAGTRTLGDSTINHRMNATVNPRAAHALGPLEKGAVRDDAARAELP